MLLQNVKYAVAALLLAAVACQPGERGDQGSTVMANGVPVGDLRGTALVNKTIQTRLLDDEAASTGSFEIERLAGGEFYALRGLLGQFSEGGSASEWRGGEPNPFGMLLWHQVLTRFAQGLAKNCDTPDNLNVSFFDGTTAVLNASFAAKLKAACTFDGDAEAKKSAASKLWRAFVGLSAAGEETAFVDLFAGAQSPFASSAPKERVEAMILAMALNPYFLLEK